MSLTKNKAIRCDWCGKLTRDKNGEYRKADGTAGYIHQPEWERFPAGDMTSKDQIQSSNDICEECAESRCPACGSEDVSLLTPSTCNPARLAILCKACNYLQWKVTNGCAQTEEEDDAENH